MTSTIDPTPLLSDTNSIPSTKRSLHVLYALNFLSSCGFAVMLPSLWPYVDSLHGSRDMLGYITTAGSAGNVIGLLLFGKTGDLWGAKPTIIITLILGSGASLWYAIATANWMILVARAISGFAGGRITVCNAYVVRVTTVKERTGAMALMGGLTILGVCAGPAIGTLLSLPNVHLGPITLNEYTCPGYMWMILSCVALMVVAKWFVEVPPKSERSASDANDEPIIPTITPQQSLQHMMETSSSYEDVTIKLQNQIRDAQYTALFCIIVQAIGFYVYLVLQTLIPPIIDEDYHYHSLENGICWSLIAIIGILSFIVIRILAKRGVSDVRLICSGLIFMTLGNIFLAEFPWTPNVDMLIHTFTKKLEYWRFVMGMITMAIGFTQADAVSMSLYSKSMERWNHLYAMRIIHQQQHDVDVRIIDVESIQKSENPGEKKWGGVMSIILAVQASARTIGPIIGTQLYDHWNTRNVFLLSACFLISCLIIQCIWWSYMIRTIEMGKEKIMMSVDTDVGSVNPIVSTNKMRLLTPDEIEVGIEEWR